MELRALVVDDSIVARLSLRRILAGMGIEAREESSGEAAIGFLSDGVGVDLVFLDITMPGMSGLEALRLIKASWPSLPVIMVTADVQQGSLDEAMADGAAGVVRKPADAASVAAALAGAGLAAGDP